MLSHLRNRTSINRLQALSSQIRAASTMKEAIVSRGPKVQIIESAIPKAGPGQVVVKIEYAGSNPKDW
jgi:NADPH:quinone reductase